MTANQILMPIAAGLSDAVNPCALTTALMFLLLLSVFWERNISLWWGACFIVLIWIVSLTFINVAVMTVLYSYEMRDAIAVTYHRLGYGLVIIGLLQLFDWWLARSRGLKAKFFFNFPSMPSRQTPASIRKWALPVFLTLVLPVVLAVLQNDWAPNFYMNVIMTDLMLPGKQRDAVIAIAIYQVLMLWPLGVVMAGAFGLVRTMKSGKDPAALFSMYKSVVSALFIAFGISLVYIYK